jgi:hypothetical protein
MQLYWEVPKSPYWRMLPAKSATTSTMEPAISQSSLSAALKTDP